MGSMFATLSVDSDFAAKDMQWWRDDLTDREIHKKLASSVYRIRQGQLWRKQADLQHLRLYGNAPILGFGIANYTKPAQLTGGKVGLNIARSCSDSLTAKLCSDEMRPRILTNGGDWTLQQKAQGLEKFLEGQCHALETGEKFAWMVLQACIFGSGLLKICRAGRGKTQRIVIDQTPTWSLMVDDQEALYGRPPNLYQRMWWDRRQLWEAFRGNAKAQDIIARAKLQTDEDLDAVGYQATADQVLVTESWHLPSGPGANDGRHAMMLENGLLYAEPYEYDEFPFVHYTLWPQPLGWYGVGIVQQVQGLQVELNVLMQKIQRSFHLLGSGHVLLDRGSKANKHKIDNDIGSIWEYVGVKPEIVATNPVPPQIFEHIDRIYSRAFELSGISQLESQSLKPKGLNSGVALDTYLDVTTERFNVSQRRLQRCFVRLCTWILRMAAEISESNPDFGVLSHDKSAADIVHFKKNALEEDQYVMRLYPTSSLADDPAEKMEQVERMVNAGWIDANTARRLLDFPDLEEFESLDLSGFNAVEWCIAKALKEGEYVGPQPFLPLGTQSAPGPAIKQVQNALVRAWVRGAPEDRLRLLKNWLSDAVAMMTPPPAPAPPPPGASPGNDMPGLPAAGAPPGNDLAAKVQGDIQGQMASQAAQGLMTG